ncbi:MAG: hypothetical protein KAI24_02745, partial [Planctomycetes bacterium]|nr:hypothetical protein [Planctomycetota bacterium]
GGIELLVVRARTLVRAGDRAAAKAVVARIPGHTWGALRRVQLQLELGDDAAALATAAAVSLPGLRDLARGHVADWLDANGRPDEARRVRGLRGRAGPR